MKLIEYEETMEKAFEGDKGSTFVETFNSADSLILLDIAHSMSIIAEESIKDRRRKARKVRSDYQSRYYKARRKES